MQNPRLSERALRVETNEAELRKALADKDATVVEWESAGFTFLRSPNTCTIIRAGALGGDVRTVHFGWRYWNVDQMDLDWAEILSLVNSFRRAGITD